MSTTYYLIDWKNNRKDLTEAEVIELLGEARFEDFIDGAKQLFFEEPGSCTEVILGPGRLGVEFD